MDLEPSVVGVKETRINDGRLEGLVELSDGTSEWREPSKVTAEATITRADGSVEHRELQNVELGCE